ncbi:hydantoinase carbamoylase family amidase [Trichoderma arundinaceum]|uniref:Hydantoinase carbamoylase family amidase n=1 Tax=Trichoderma arundinaceum TaxID=490622 RepID=A0A395P088_TRIAR|nr:hydantoinase carbamoylase family amidase [Trichoderma arundinaceum]
MPIILRKAASSAARRFYSASHVSAPASGLRINADRLQETIHHTCQWGAAHRYGSGSTETGMARLSLSDDDAQARRWFAEETQRLGCNLVVDQLGNMFASKRGSAPQPTPMIAMGSHLDTQPRGGRYDGILGVVAAVEVLRTLTENGYKTHHNVGAVNWTNEEGARFPKSMMASGVWAGKIPLEQAYSLADIFNPSATVKSELQRLGYIGDVACSSDSSTGYPLGAHFELHIEQGPILEETGKKIGVVQGGQGYRWFTVTINGRDAHTGTTPLKSRSDPLLAASKMIASSNAIAKNLGALASTGVIKIPPSSSTNTIASQVTFTLDVRHPDDAIVDQVQRLCFESFQAIAKEDGRGVQVDWTIDTDSPATKFDPDCIKMVEKAATDLVGADGWLHITSGAGHDSVNTSSRCPTTMIFVPCRDGVSHHPEEYCSPEDCALGAQALLEAVVNYDKLKAGQ